MLQILAKLSNIFGVFEGTEQHKNYCRICNTKDSSIDFI